MPVTWIKDFIKHRAEPLLLPLEVVRGLPALDSLMALPALRHPIIIGGCGRSGTTLMLSVLSCHQQLHVIGDETGALCPHAYDDVDGIPDTSLALRLDILLRHVLREGLKPGALRVCEKSPRNVQFFGRILDHWGPRVRLINMVRDGRHVVTSRHPGLPDGYWVSPKRWLNDVQAGARFEDHPQVLTVRYEDLTSEYEATMRRICDFIDMQFMPAFLDYPDSARLTGSAEKGAWFEPRRAVQSQDKDRWRQPEHKHVIEELLGDEQARKLLVKYGYGEDA